ncbi:L-aspartate oxidase [Virgibacillus phasianinus]|uniref:L-aspartate oxidase n=1 Tax=Virgibacillus phasianinus TaxID=2017483 RepID=A0A220U3M5_9BACI|nr:L-aspartate oxidase [Virgibacillus phasianinus]ASK62582.1 L-aspartate oxidase [Virgibacillus phasianinus]
MAFDDVIIIGSGIAALTAAEKLATDRNVIIFTKSKRTVSNSFHAQGGIAAAVDQGDTWEEHLKDTEVAGCQHSDLENLQMLMKKAPKHLFDLAGRGLEFDRNKNGEWNLGREGGHLKRRILHAGGDATGKALMTFMLKQIKSKVTILEDEMVIDLIVRNQHCIGIKTKTSAGNVINHFAGATILATGGCGQLYAYTSNDSTITGDGIAMAFRAGVQLVDMEFVQFHPTLLFDGINTIGLVSEAVRGEGAYLVNDSNRRIMESVHKQKDLAPRDIVARTIFKERAHGKNVYLNISNVKNFSDRFPSISRMCVESGIDLEGNLLPVTPGAHFMMGGVKADTSGQTSLSGLYAVGETACTGVHGANRVASNSLLEGIVFGNMTAESILNQNNPVVEESIAAKKSGIPVNLPAKETIKQRMMRDVGVVRGKRGLRKMIQWLGQYRFSGVDLDGLSVDEVERINMMTTAWLITTSAWKRKESRGAHYRSDYPTSNGIEKRQEIVRQKESELVEEILI